MKADFREGDVCYVPEKNPEVRWPRMSDEEERSRIAFLAREVGGRDLMVEPWASMRDELEWRRTDGPIVRGERFDVKLPVLP